MERYATEAMKAERDAAVKHALKAKVPLFEIAEEFGLSEAELGVIIAGQGPPRHDDIVDARTAPKLVARGR
jgi:hypothetical protein